MTDPYAIAGKQEALNKALRAERFDDAMELYGELDALEPEEPRWPHRRGDLYRRLGHTEAACSSYAVAVERYSALGFVARAAALAKLIVGLDPSRAAVMDKVDAAPAKALHEQERGPRAPFRDKARPLVRADEADDDETRFSNVDGAIELELTDLELIVDDDDVIVLDDDELRVSMPHAPEAPEPQRRSSQDLAKLPSMPLFAEIPKAALKRLLRGCDVSEVPQGQTLLEEGDIADALFVLVEGEAEVKVAERERSLRVREGDIVGESCLLDNVQRGADVVALTPLIALRIPKRDLDDCIEAHPEVGAVLEEVLGRRLIANLLQTSPIFAAFDPASRKELAALFELRTADDETVLIEQGKRCDGVYCVLLGTLRCDGQSLGPGTVVGQRSLLEHSPAAATVECESEVMLLRLPRERFNELAALYPPVLAALAELAASEHGL